MQSLAEGEIVVPGQRIAPADSYIPGTGIYVLGSYLHASAVGKVQVQPAAKGI